MNKYWRLAGVVLLLILAANFGVSGYFWLRHRPAALKAKMVASGMTKLPKGSSRAKVAAFLSSQGLESSFINGKESLDYSSVVGHNGYTSANIGGYSAAIVRGTSGNVLISGDTTFLFFFDKNDRLLKSVTQEVFTGP